MKRNIKLCLLCLTSLLLASCQIDLFFGDTTSIEDTTSGSGSGSTQIPGPNPNPGPDSTPEAQTFTVKLDVGTNGTVGEETATVTLGESFTLPVPTPNPGYVFRGWEQQGNLITGADGQGFANWIYEQDVTVTARFVRSVTIDFWFKSIDLGSITYASDENFQDALQLDLNVDRFPLFTEPIWGWFTASNNQRTVTSIDDLIIDSNFNTALYSQSVSQFDSTNFTDGVLTSSDNGKTASLQTLDLRRMYIRGKTITGIGANAFQGNTALNTIYIPKTVTSIESGALTSATNLTTINLELPYKPETGYDDVWDESKITVNWGVPPTQQ